MKKILLLIFCILGVQTFAQNTMRITMNDGTSMDFRVNNVQDVCFSTEASIDIVGEWVTVSEAYGSMECLCINEDGTMKYKYYYMDYQMYGEFDGTYTFENNVLNCSVMGSSIVVSVAKHENTEFTSSTNLVFYKVLDTYTMNMNDEPVAVGNEGDTILYADNCFAGIYNNRIKALQPGVGYALVRDVETGKLNAYSINVAYKASEIVDWTRYLKKTKDNIIAEFGNPNQTNESKCTITYYLSNNTDIEMLSFAFDEKFEKVTGVHVYFYDEGKMKHYYDYIKENYILSYSSETTETYYDTEDKDVATVEISVKSGSDLNTITYSDLTE